MIAIPRCWHAALFASLVLLSSNSVASESLWLEAEHFRGLRGYCWPMGRPEMKKTDGCFGLSGPGWAAEWNQGGESGFLSIATGADDDKAMVEHAVEIPVAGEYHVWVRYGDWREQPERFEVQIEQPGAAKWTAAYGEQAVVEEDNVMKLYFGWSFAWDQRSATLNKGPATIRLASTTKSAVPRQIDVVVLTTDAAYRPRIKDRPASEVRALLDSYRDAIPADLEPLTRRRFGPAAHTAEISPTANDAASWQPAAQLPDAWKLKTFRDKGFVYLWNTNADDAAKTWLGDDPNRVKFPYNVIDPETKAEFEKKFAAAGDVPIFSDPRIVPTFHGVGAGIFATDPNTAEVNQTGKLFAKWLDANPDRAWAMMMNYHGGAPIGDAGLALFQKYRDRYVGSIAGESLGYFYPKPEEMRQVTAAATTRRQLAEAFTPLMLRENAAKYRAVYGKDIDANAYIDVIPCLSVGNITFTPLTFDWGARIGGYESAAATFSVLPMRWAFTRGAARQWGGLTATYRSCNFGDSATIFSNSGSYHTPQSILDNYYSVYSGAGMTWYKFDIWYQYMAGSSMFYHEQGFDEFWRPGGTTAAGVQEVQLSPKGKLVDRFLRLTAKDPDRGAPYTPVAFLVDYAHGWEPSAYWPNAFKNLHEQPDRFLTGDHEAMLKEFFSIAWHPIEAESEKPITGTSEVNVAGVFGDVFDVIYAYPDVSKWRTIDSYPVVIAAGEIELTKAEGQRLAQYVNSGGTLLVADAHLTGEGLADLGLPAAGAELEAEFYDWRLGERAIHSAPRFRYRPIDVTSSNGRPLATTPDGVFCAAWDRGQGRIIQLSIPHGLTISKRPHPVVARLLAHLTRGVMPVQVDGDVGWMLNRAGDCWLVTLLNPAGDLKPQQGLFPTDYRENRAVVIRSHLPITTARDRLLPDQPLGVENNTVRLEVPAGGVRVVELR